MLENQNDLFKELPVINVKDVEFLFAICVFDFQSLVVQPCLAPQAYSQEYKNNKKLTRQK